MLCPYCDLHCNQTPHFLPLQMDREIRIAIGSTDQRPWFQHRVITTQRSPIDTERPSELPLHGSPSLIASESQKENGSSFQVNVIIEAHGGVDM